MTAKKQPAVTSEAVKKIEKEITAKQGELTERVLAREAAIQALHLKELENLPDGPKYFQTRYLHEQLLLHDSIEEMAAAKAKYLAAKKRRELVIARLCNLNSEIEEQNSPIIKLSKSMEDEGWRRGEVGLLTKFGLPDSVAVLLLSEGYGSVGSLFEDESWKDIPGLGEATQDKINDATKKMIQSYDDRLQEMKSQEPEQTPQE